MNKEYKIWEVLEVIKGDTDLDFESDDFLITTDECSGYTIAINKHTNDIASGTLLSCLLEDTYTEVKEEEEDELMKVSRIGFVSIGEEQTLITTGVLFPNGGSVLMKSLIEEENINTDTPDVMIEFTDVDAVEAFQDILEDLKDQMLGKCE